MILIFMLLRVRQEKIKQTNLDRYDVENSGWIFSVTKHERGHLDTLWGTHWYRSSWEKLFLEWCLETRTEVLDGNIGIPYVHNGKNRIYYADFLVLYNGRRILCEIKPAKLAVLEVNKLKFEAAKKWCDINNSIFMHIDELALLDLSEHFDSACVLFKYGSKGTKL